MKDPYRGHEAELKQTGDDYRSLSLHRIDFKDIKPGMTIRMCSAEAPINHWQFIDSVTDYNTGRREVKSWRYHLINWEPEIINNKFELQTTDVVTVVQVQKQGFRFWLETENK